MKTCKECKQLKEPEQFYKEKRSVDGLTAVCRICKQQRQKDIKSGIVEPKQILRRHKVLKVARKLAEGESLQDAYFSLGTTKDKHIASSAASTFIKNFGDVEKNLFRQMLTPAPILSGIRNFFNDILTREVPSTIDEYNKTLANWCKMTGAYVDNNTTTTTLTTEQSITTLEEVAKMLEKQEEKKQLKE